MRTGLLSTFAIAFAVAIVPASPALAKNDGDGIPAKFEKRYHLNLRVNDAGRDADHDGLSNFGEYRAHTDPHKRDSDRNHRPDGREDYDRDKLRNAAEIRTGNDPGDADSDDDGIKDGAEHAGVITAAGAQSVTISLATGGTVTAAVGDGLEVTCAPGASGPGDGAADPGVPEPGEDDDFDGSQDQPAVHSDDEPAAEPDDSSDDGEPGDDSPLAMASSDSTPCGSSALKVGAVVHDAEIELTGDGPSLVAIELVPARHR